MVQQEQKASRPRCLHNKPQSSWIYAIISRFVPCLFPISRSDDDLFQFHCLCCFFFFILSLDKTALWSMLSCDFSACYSLKTNTKQQFEAVWVLSSTSQQASTFKTTSHLPSFFPPFGDFTDWMWDFFAPNFLSVCNYSTRTAALLLL